MSDTLLSKSIRSWGSKHKNTFYILDQLLYIWCTLKGSYRFNSLFSFLQEFEMSYIIEYYHMFPLVYKHKMCFQISLLIFLAVDVEIIFTKDILLYAWSSFFKYIVYCNINNLFLNSVLDIWPYIPSHKHVSRGEEFVNFC